MNRKLEEVRRGPGGYLEEECSSWKEQLVQSPEPGVFQEGQKVMAPGWGVRGEGNGTRKCWRDWTNNLTG